MTVGIIHTPSLVDLFVSKCGNCGCVCNCQSPDCDNVNCCCFQLGPVSQPEPPVHTAQPPGVGGMTNDTQNNFRQSIAGGAERGMNRPGTAHRQPFIPASSAPYGRTY